MVWEHLLKAVSPGELDLRDGILIHSGGWKKLAERAVGNHEYKAELERVTGLRRVHNFYGMAEQIGTVFVECERGFLHAPNASDIIVRDPATWDVVTDGEMGVAQMLSALPESYPGHSILTEDFARVEAVDSCPCGRYGKAVSILGRVPEAEIRGCSDIPTRGPRSSRVTVERLVPRVGAVEVGEVLCGLRRAPRRHVDPFHPARIDFSDAVSRAIFHHPRSRAFPEMLAVAFWLRRAAVTRLADRFAALEAGGSLRAPRGLAFHLPPTNVETLFVYSLMASFLVGNLNVVRVSRSRRTEQVTLLCEVLRAVLAEDRFAEFSDELAVVSYAHEAEPTAAVSKEADVRLLWGGDETVDRLRPVPIGAGAHDLTFGDRFSFAVLRPDAVLEADHESRYTLAQRLFNDAYWFDQLACSSPRLLVWVGGHAEVDAARQVLFTELARVVAVKGYRLEPGAAIAKLTFMYGALIDRPVESVYQVGNELLVLSFEAPRRVRSQSSRRRAVLRGARQRAVGSGHLREPQGPNPYRVRVLH